ncbi:MAG: DUF1013 domain-containing protein [Rhodospirillaceae bacterium]|nr:DUF1013 domain-containing protein [Rhodospirillaceae bacterium]MDE0618697.1 DUF1013 domain-containing protein [Rhodospirillaceae bacterium]
MNRPMMPKATAVWLVENTALTFGQIAEFCELHELEVQAIADEDIVSGMAGIDPIQAEQLTQEEIDRCQADPTASLVLKETDIPTPVQRSRGARYTPIAKRQDKPDGIAWLLKHHPELTDAQISKLLGTTKTTINAVRDRSHWNSSNIRGRDPMDLGLCSYGDYNAAVEIGRARVQKENEKAEPAPEPKPAIDFGISSLVSDLPGSERA